MRFGPYAVLIVLFLPVAAGAQVFGGLGATDGSAFTLSVSPQYPAPQSEVRVSLVSSALELARATLTVSTGGKEIYKGAVRTFSVPLGAAGSITAVKVTVTADGTPYTQTLSLAPQDVVLVAEPISSSPPLYAGKPSVPLGGQVRIVAMADLRGAGGKIANKTLYSYSWTIGGVWVANSSGIGKSAIVVDSPLQYRTREVSVTVTSGDGSLVGGASLTLSPSEPSLRVYENDSLLGIRFERALPGAYTLKGAEATLYAAPFSLTTGRGAPMVEWFLNGSPAQTGNSITLRPTGSGRGTALLSLTASSGGLASALANVALSFGSVDTNFFGL